MSIFVGGLNVQCTLYTVQCREVCTQSNLKFINLLLIQERVEFLYSLINLGIIIQPLLGLCVCVCVCV